MKNKTKSSASLLIVSFTLPTCLFSSEAWILCANSLPKPKPYPSLLEQTNVTIGTDFIEIVFICDQKTGKSITLKLNRKSIDTNGAMKAASLSDEMSLTGTGKITKRDEAGNPTEFECRVFKDETNEISGQHIVIKKIHINE